MEGRIADSAAGRMDRITESERWMVHRCDNCRHPTESSAYAGSDVNVLVDSDVEVANEPVAMNARVQCVSVTWR